MSFRPRVLPPPDRGRRLDAALAAGLVERAQAQQAHTGRQWYDDEAEDEKYPAEAEAAEAAAAEAAEAAAEAAEAAAEAAAAEKKRNEEETMRAKEKAEKDKKDSTRKPRGRLDGDRRVARALAETRRLFPSDARKLQRKLQREHAELDLGTGSWGER